MLLESLGHPVIQASSGTCAINILADNSDIAAHYRLYDAGPRWEDVAWSCLSRSFAFKAANTDDVRSGEARRDCKRARVGR
jgi:hypothetical protein